MVVDMKVGSVKCLSSTRLGMDVDRFGLGLLRWVRESVLSSKAPHRERVEFVLDGDEDGKGKGKKGDACLNLAMTKREDSVVGPGCVVFFSFFLFLLALGMYFNVMFQPESGLGATAFDFLEYYCRNTIGTL